LHVLRACGGRQVHSVVAGLLRLRASTRT
jgi:hypothetical protein